MSIRSITVQYVGNVLFLPKLERNVKLIVERNYETADPDKQFVMERTCKFVSSKGSDYPPVCSACGYELGIYDCEWFDDGTYGYGQNYCPNCGAKVVGE